MNILNATNYHPARSLLPVTLLLVVLLPPHVAVVPSHTVAALTARRPAIASPNTTSSAAIIARVERATEAVRGLHAHHSVPVTLLSPAQFKALVARNFDHDMSAATIRDADQPLVLLGVLSPQTDLRAILRASQLGSVAAFYDLNTKRLYIPVSPGGLSLNDRVIISHEYTHALQDQNFNLNRVRPDTSNATIHDSDRDLAETALIEGDATVEMLLYAQTTFSQDQYTQFQREAAQAANAANASDHAPHYLLDGLDFPYTYGSTFEQQLLQQSNYGLSFDRVNRAFRQPPISTREIMHPDLYLRDPSAPTPDVPVPRVVLPRGWTRVDSDVIGQYELQDLLAQQIDAARAAEAADGWRADRYALFDGGHDSLMAWHLHSASASASKDLARALVAYFSRRYGKALSISHNPLTFSTTHSALAMQLSGSEIFAVLASQGALQPVVSQALATLH